MLFDGNSARSFLYSLSLEVVVCQIYTDTIRRRVTMIRQRMTDRERERHTHTHTDTHLGYIHPLLPSGYNVYWNSLLLTKAD